MHSKFWFFSCFVLLTITHNPSPVLSSSRELTGTINPNTDLLEGTNYTVSSEYTQKNYSVKVKLPPNYDENRAQGYPVYLFLDYLYQPNPNLDGFTYTSYLFNEYFINFTSLREDDPLIPEFIMVTVIHQNLTFSSMYSDMIVSSHNMYLMLTEEVLPIITTDFNVDENELTLSGGDFGGAFVLGAFFDYIDSPFKYFISMYPALNGLIEEFAAKEEQMFENSKNQTLPHRRLYLRSHQGQGEAFNFLINMSTYINLRDYNTQSFFRWFEPVIVFIPTMTREAWSAIYKPEPILTFLTNVELESFLGTRDDPLHYVNETIMFIFNAYMGNRTNYNITWYLFADEISTDRIHEYVFENDGIVEFTLKVVDEYNNTYIRSRTFAINPIPVPPFDFRTADPPVNEETYSTDTVTETVPFNPFYVAFIMVPILSQLKKRIKLKNI